MASLEYYLPVIAMLVLQVVYAGISLGTRTVLLEGMSPRVFVVYRQAMATVVIVPIAYFSGRKSGSCSLNLRSFSLIFITSLIGITLNQNLYYEGLYLASASIGSAMANLVPAITFIIAALVGMERVNMRSTRTIAKIVGTMICVSGALSMALLKGPKLLNAENLPSKSVMGLSGGENWLLGCLFLFASSCCWSLWLILQVPSSASHPSHLSLSAWMCLMGTLQSAAVTIFLEPDLDSWKIHSLLEFGCSLYSGVMGSSVSFFVQAWCISRRGPLFSAMFSPLMTVIVTILAAILLHEEICLGSLIGAIGVIIGLYVVLWGKAEEFVEVTDPKLLHLNDPNPTTIREEVKVMINESDSEKAANYINDLEEPLLSSNSHSSQC